MKRGCADLQAKAAQIESLAIRVVQLDKFVIGVGLRRHRVWQNFRYLGRGQAGVTVGDRHCGAGCAGA